MNNNSRFDGDDFFYVVNNLMMFVFSSKFTKEFSLHGFMNDDRFKSNTNPMIHSNKMVNPCMRFLFFYHLFQFFYSLSCLIFFFSFLLCDQSQSFQDKKFYTNNTRLKFLEIFFLGCFLFLIYLF